MGLPGERLAVSALGLAATLFFVAAGPHLTQIIARPIPSPSFEERLLYEMPTEPTSVMVLQGRARFFSVHFSPSGRRVAYTASENGKEFYVVDGQRQPPFDGVGPLVFSEDESTLVYNASVGDKSTVVMDSTGGPLADEDWWPPYFSPACRILAYKAVRGGRAFAVRGTHEDPAYDEVSRPVFSPDCKSVAYAAQSGKRHFIVLNGHRGPAFSEVSDPVFRPDGSMLYAARLGRKGFIVDRGRRGPPFDKVRYPAVSPDGKIVAFVARMGQDYFVVKGESRSPTYEFADSLAFDRYGNFWYKASTAHGEAFVINGESLPGFGTVFDLVLSRDGRTSAFGAGANGKTFVVFGDRRYEPLRFLENIVLSPDARRVACTGADDGGFHAVVDGKKDEAVGWVSRPIFSSDSQSLAYIAGIGPKSCVVVNGIQGPLHDSVQSLAFSPDSKSVAYGARDGRELWRRVIAVPGGQEEK